MNAIPYLTDLQKALEGQQVPTRIEGDTLVAEIAPYVVRTQVAAPRDAERMLAPQPGRELTAVIRTRSTLPAHLAPHFKEAVTLVTANRVNSFGALTLENGEPVVASRLSIYGQEREAWELLHLKLVMFSAFAAGEPIVGALRRQAAQEAPEASESEWTQADLEAVAAELKPVAECSLDDTGLRATFDLGGDGGEKHIAHLDMIRHKPHPEMGGGLLCLLQMPYSIEPQEEIAGVCNRLNELELAGDDLPPHFGAWCIGNTGNNPAYAMFLPNALYTLSGIAINVGFWSYGRAKWADAVLSAATASR